MSRWSDAAGIVPLRVLREVFTVPIHRFDGFGWLYARAVRMDQPESCFLEAPVETDLTRLDAKFAILGVPFGWPYPRPGATAGCREAPSAVR